MRKRLNAAATFLATGIALLPGAIAFLVATVTFLSGAITFSAGVVAFLAGAPLSAQQPEAFDHSVFDELLRANVNRDGLVDYDAFGRSPEFQEYLAALSAADLEPLSEPERLALWINAYNAYTIELINRHGERESIRNINRTLGLFGGKGPWKERIANVAGDGWTLNEIEHEIVRKRFSEPRIHFALVCAALGCPSLRNEAYSGERLDHQLDEQARAFLLESPAKNRIDTAEGVAYLSPIFDWYREDFPPGSTGLGGYLAPFHAPGPARELLESGRFQVKHTHYDWSLNREAGPDPGQG